MTILLPIGHDLGAIHTDEPDDTDVYKVRLGAEIIGLNRREYSVWRTLADVTDGKPHSPSSFAAVAREHGAADYKSILEQLTEPGLVANVLPIGAAAKRFTQTHRLVPLAHAVGNSSEDKDAFRIYLGGEQALAVSWLMYYLWVMAPTHTNLAAGVALASAEQRDQAKPGEVKTEDQIQTLVLETLSTLLAHRCAYLDTVT